MKFRALWILCLLPVFTGLFFGGCGRQVANPTFPPTNTFTSVPIGSFTNTPNVTSTFTITRTMTSTATVTTSPTLSTPSATFTITSTPTQTSTSTITASPTETHTTIPGSTDTFTSTVTSTPSITHTASPTVTSTATSGTTACTKLMCSFESLTENGSVAAAAATITVTDGPSHATLGSNALQISIATGGGCNLFSWTSFAPSTWTNVTQVVMDVYIDPSLISGTTNQFGLFESSSASGWWTQITDYTDVVAGAQSVTLTVDWAKGVFNSTSVMSNLILVWNTNGTGTGNFYIDNVRLVGSVGVCPPSPPSTCGLMDSFETASENGTLSAAATVCSVGYSTSYATLGNKSFQAAITIAGGCNLFSWTGFAPSKWPDVTDVIMDVYIDPGLISGATNQLGLFESSAASGWWTQITDYTDVVAGSQSVTLTVDWAKGKLTSASVLSNLILVWNNNGTGTGSVYIDNVRLSNGVSCNP